MLLWHWCGKSGCVVRGAWLLPVAPRSTRRWSTHRWQPRTTHPAFFRPRAQDSDAAHREIAGYRRCAMDDRRAALLLSVLALTGAGVRYVIAPSAAPPGDVALAAVDSPPRGGLQ